MAWGLLFSSLLLGLLGGVHCTAMCSGLVCSLCGSRELKAQCALLCGRLLSYTAAGTLLGGGAPFLAQFKLAGGAFAAFSHLFQWAAVALALLMLLAPQLRFFQFNAPLHMPGAGFSTVQWGAVQPARKKHLSRFYPGLLWAGLPCGLLQSALVLAWFSGSAWLGALSMAVFAVVSGFWLLGLGQVLARALQRWPAREMAIRRITGALLLAGLFSAHFAAAGEGGVTWGEGFFCLPQF